jgi:hypothetical protein
MINSLRLATRSQYEYVGRALADTVSFASAANGPHSKYTFGASNVMSELAKLCANQTERVQESVSLDEAKSLFEELRGSNNPWPLIVRISSSLGAKRLEKVLTALLRDMGQVNRNDARYQRIIKDTREGRANNIAEYNARTISNYVDSLEREQKNKMLGSDDYENYYSTMRINVLHWIVKALENRQHVNTHTPNFSGILARHPFEEMDKPQFQVLSQAVLSVKPSGGIPMDEFRVKGYWLTLCHLLMPSIAPTYQSCLSHIYISESEERVAESFRTTYNDVEFANAVKDPQPAPGDPQSKIYNSK